MDSMIMAILIILAIIVLIVGGIIARRVLVPKARNAGQATLARQAPDLLGTLGTGLGIPGTPEEARARVEAFVQLKPKARRSEPDGSWSLRVLEPDDVVIELVTAEGGGSVLWPRSARADAQGSAVNANIWYLFSHDLGKALAKQGVAVESVPGREFALDQTVSPAVWRALG